MKDALFHPKVWLFEKGGEVVATHGSSNVTYAGIRKNIEQIAISRSWQDPNQRYITDKLCYEFGRLWENKDNNCLVIGLPEAVRHRLLRTYSSASPPTEDELRALCERATGSSEEPKPFQPACVPRTGFATPNWLQYEDGPFEHQGKAVAAWCAVGFRGVLEMATGSGKTITSMIGAHRLHEGHKPLLIIVAAPYVPLIEQWCDEIAPFGLTPANLTTAGGAARRASELQKLKRRLRTGLSDVEAVVVSHDTLCTPEFLATVETFDCARLLIADEAHNLGRPSFTNDPPEFFEYRLGLSATPIRQYDQEGTEALFGFKAVYAERQRSKPDRRAGGADQRRAAAGTAGGLLYRWRQSAELHRSGCRPVHEARAGAARHSLASRARCHRQRDQACAQIGGGSEQEGEAGRHRQRVVQGRLAPRSDGRGPGGI